MKCCSRSTLGVLVGIFNIVCYIGITIFSIVFLAKLDSIDIETIEEENAIAMSRAIFICVIALCLIMTIVAGLLITGIVKKYHTLMVPWLLIAGVSYFFKCLYFFNVFFTFVSSGASLSFLSLYTTSGFAGFAISAMILWTIFKLYTDIRQENIEKPNRHLVIAENGFQKF